MVKDKKNWLIHTKLSPPHSRTTLQLSHGLQDQLGEVLNYKTCIINAIAGYGKTTLMKSWYDAAIAQNLSAGWLSLDEFDQRRETLNAYLIELLSQALGDKSELSRIAGTKLENLEIRSLVSFLIEKLEASNKKVCLFFDDFHRAETEEFDEFLQTLIRYAPANLCIFLATRTYPKFDIEQLRAQGMVIDVTTNDLKLSGADVLQMADGKLTQKQSILLQQHTEGWPIACNIACYLLEQGSLKGEDLGQYSGHNMDLSNYISEQVFNTLNKTEKTFLMLASIAERFSGDLVAKLDTSLDTWTVLDSLLQRKIILSPLDLNGEWYRCHQVLADFLYSRLLKNRGKSVSDIHAAASSWFFENGFLREAVEQALKAKDYTLAAMQLDASGGWRLAFEGKLEFVRQFLDLLPKETIDRHPRLFMAHLAKLLREGKVVQARKLGYAFKLKSDNFARLDSQLLPENVRTELEVIIDVLLDMYADVPTTQEKMTFLEKLLTQIDRDDKTLLSIVDECLMRQHLEKGDLEHAKQYLKRLKELGLEESERSIYAFVYQCIDTTMIAVSEIRLHEATKEIEKAKQAIEQYPSVDFNLQAAVSVFEAEIAYLQNNLAHSSFLIDTSLRHLERYDAGLIHYAPAFLALFGITYVQGDRPAMTKVLDRAIAISQARRIPRLQQLAQILKVKYLAMIGEVEEAMHEAKDIDLEGLAVQGGTTQDLSVFVPEQACIALARLYFCAEKPTRAISLLQNVIEKAKKQNRYRMWAEAELLHSLALFKLGDKDRAAEKVKLVALKSMHENFTRVFINEGSSGASLFEFTLSTLENSEPNRYLEKFLKLASEEARKEHRKSASRSPGLAITNLEYQVVAELVRGYSNKEIARILNVSEDTVKYRLKKVFKKWQVSTRAEAAKIAQQHFAQSK